MRVLCYQPSCHSCYQLAIFSKSVAASVLLQLWRHDCLSATNFPDTVTVSVFIYEITCCVFACYHILTDPLTPVMLKLHISCIFRIVIISLMYQQNVCYYQQSPTCFSAYCAIFRENFIVCSILLHCLITDLKLCCAWVYYFIYNHLKKKTICGST